MKVFQSLTNITHPNEFTKSREQRSSTETPTETLIKKSSTRNLRRDSGLPCASPSVIWKIPENSDEFYLRIESCIAGNGLLRLHIIGFYWSNVFGDNSIAVLSEVRLGYFARNVIDQSGKERGRYGCPKSTDMKKWKQCTCHQGRIKQIDRQLVVN